MTQRTFQSLAQAVELYYEELRHFIAQRTQSSSIAEEVVQETWIRASTTGVTMPTNPRAYLYRMANNLAIDYLRRHAVHASPPANSESELADTQALQPDAVVAAQQEIEILTRAIAELPDKCRQVFILYRQQGLTMREIARRLEVSEGTVEKHISRAMLHCRQRLKNAGRE